METHDLSDTFFNELKCVAERLDADPLDMMRVMYAESRCRADAHNQNGDASGLIQFMPTTLRGVGWREGHAAFRKLDALHQLRYVERYYAPHKGSLGSVAGLYVCTFLPAFVEHAEDPDYVLCAKGGKLSWAYDPNKSFDENKDYNITVGELEHAVDRACHGARWQELVARLTGTGLEGAPEIVAQLPPPPPLPEEERSTIADDVWVDPSKHRYQEG